MDAGPRARVLELAANEGFPLARIAPPGPLEKARAAALGAEAIGRLEGLAWMTPAWLTRSTDPDAFLAGARGILVVGLPYRGRAPGAPEDGVTRGRVAAYAAGRDYHRVFEKKLRRIAAAIRAEFGADARPTVDYGPLLERPLGALAGLGWAGKSTMLLAPGFGPWVLLGAVATTLELAADAPLKKSCGSCTRCITACPTGALAADGHLLDARLCISYHTIENRGPIPRDLRSKFGSWIFGCDDCLESCPVGAGEHPAHPDLEPHETEANAPALARLLELDEAAFVARFRGRAIMRAKRDGLLRNVCIALGNTGGPADFPALEQALADRAALVRGHAAWAICRLADRLPGDLRQSATVALEGRATIEQDPWVRDEIALALRDLTAAAPGG